MKRKVMIIALVVAIAAIIGSFSLAFFTDTDYNENTMVFGNVEIEQLEYERVVGEDGKWISTGETDKYGYSPDEVQEFTQDKPLFPVYKPTGSMEWDDRNDGKYQQSWGAVGAPGSNQLFDDSCTNVIDKFVFVKNTGKSDAYIRVLVALEQGDIAADNFKNYIMTNSDKNHWTYDGAVASNVVIGDSTYVVVSYLYVGPSSNPNGVLAPDAISYASLLQLYLMDTATQEDVQALDGNDNGKYDVLVLSQAVQTTGFANADEAFAAAFPGVNDATTLQGWFESAAA